MTTICLKRGGCWRGFPPKRAADSSTPITDRLMERDTKLLLSEYQTPQLVRVSKRRSLEKALEVWEVANDDERKQLRPILQKKPSS
jgi:hypothetical protein